MIWQPWYSWAILIFAACAGFLAIEWRHSPVLTKDEEFVKPEISPPLWVDILTWVLFFGMMILALAVL